MRSRRVSWSRVVLAVCAREMSSPLGGKKLQTCDSRTGGRGTRVAGRRQTSWTRPGRREIRRREKKELDEAMAMREADTYTFEDG